MEDESKYKWQVARSEWSDTIAEGIASMRVECLCGGAQAKIFFEKTWVVLCHECGRSATDDTLIGAVALFCDSTGSAAKLIARREWLQNHRQICASCGESKRVELTDWTAVPAVWLCRECLHEFRCH